MLIRKETGNAGALKFGWSQKGDRGSGEISQRGCTEIYDVDLKQYFDAVDHAKLMKLIARRVVDSQVLHVIKQWLS